MISTVATFVKVNSCDMIGKLTGTSAIILYTGFGYPGSFVDATYSSCTPANIAINYPTIDVITATATAIA